MTQAEKEAVLSLRQQQYSFSAIAETTGLPLGTIKSFLSRVGEKKESPVQASAPGVTLNHEEFDRCEALVKGRAPERPEKPVEPIQQGSRNLLTGLIFCGYCGNRLCYSHNKTHRKLADGTEKVYDRHLYRCYRRFSSPTSSETAVTGGSPRQQAAKAPAPTRWTR